MATKPQKMATNRRPNILRIDYSYYFFYVFKFLRKFQNGDQKKKFKKLLLILFVCVIKSDTFLLLLLFTNKIIKSKFFS